MLYQDSALRQSYLGEFDHVNRVSALLPLFGFLITVGKIQAAVGSCELVSVHLCVHVHL